MKPLVGIDLMSIAFRNKAPGTGRYVLEQARALFKLDLPWTWVPLAGVQDRETLEEFSDLNPISMPQDKRLLHFCLRAGSTWQSAGCVLGFCTSYFVPFRNIPVVTNFFDSNFLESVDAWHKKNSGFWRQFLLRRLYLHSLRKSQKLLVLSHFCAEKLSAFSPSGRSKIMVTPCGVHPPRPKPATIPAWAPMPGKSFFLYVGSFSDNKNQRTLLAAWRKWQTEDPKAPCLVMIGPCLEGYMREIIAPAIASLPRPHEIVVPGFITDDELAWAYHHAQVYIQPSIAEGFGMPIIEAMTYDLPVACSSTTSLPETAGGAALLFNPYDADEIGRTIRDIHHSPALRADLIRLGKERAASFSWEKNAETVARVIAEELRKLK